MDKGVKNARVASRTWCRAIALLVILQSVKCDARRQTERFPARTDSKLMVSFVSPGVWARQERGTDASPHAERRSKRRQSRTKERKELLVCRHLFFRSPSPGSKKSPWRVPEAALVDLGSGVTFPYEISLETDAEEVNVTSKNLTVRYLEFEDLETVLPMCQAEFGSGKTAEIWDFPWDDLNWPKVKDWWERLTFERFLELSIRLKIRRRKGGENRFNALAKPDDSIICLAQQEEIVGIVELSLQPPDAERNPPPFPVPLWAKQLMSKQKGIPPPEGWITNLLVDKRQRRQGYGKVLCCAAEGLARSWGCNYIYLHTVADTVSGSAPQTLYRGLDYVPVIDQRSDKKYAWMGPELLNLGLYIVEGVPLLFLRKQLNSSQVE